MQNCYRSQKIPRDTQADQDERLSNKHIQTLKFLQEIVEENKKLKAKIQEYEDQLSECAELHEFANNAKDKIAQIQTQYLGRADQINDMLAEKHNVEIMQKVEEKVVAEKQWLEEKQKLETQIINLKKKNLEQKNSLTACEQHEHQIRMLDLKVAAQAQELERLAGVVDIMKITEENQTAEIQRLQNVENKNQNLKDEIAALIQTNKELKFKISKLEKELDNSGDQAVKTEQDEVINSLKNKLSKLYKENSTLEGKETEYLQHIDSLKAEIGILRKTLSDSETMRFDMQSELDMLIREIDNLKRQLARRDKDREKENFKEYVQLKREVQQLREENALFKSRHKSSKSTGHLPTIKGNDRGLVSDPRQRPLPTYAS